MNGDPLPRGAHVFRYAPPSKAKIPGSAFVRRPTDHDGLSVNRADYYTGTREEQLVQVRQVIQYELKKTGRFLEIGVEAAAAFVAAHIPEIALGAVEMAVEAKPPKHPIPDPSHALLTGLPAHDDPQAERVGDLIAKCIIEPHYPGIVDEPPPLAASVGTRTSR